MSVIWSRFKIFSYLVHEALKQPTMNVTVEPRQSMPKTLERLILLFNSDFQLSQSDPPLWGLCDSIISMQTGQVDLGVIRKT